MNEARLQAFIGRVLQDLGAAQSAVLVVVGDRLGLYRAMAGRGPVTPAALARHTATSERYVREWLVNQAAGGYVEYDAPTETFTLPDEQAAVLATEGGRASLAGAFQMATALAKLETTLVAAFRSGGGIPYAEYGPDFVEGMDRASRARYGAYLLSSWLPALDDVSARLEAGASAADVGCGRGSALLLLARAFPRSHFTGFDTHAPSIEHARRATTEAGLADRVVFEVATATDFPGAGYVLVTCLDALHDLADPVAAARRVREALAPNGAWLIVEPPASDRLEDSPGVLGRLLSSVSTLHCLPVSLAEGGPALGALAGETRIRDIVQAGGLTRFRRIAESPFNLIFEARP